MKKERFYRRLVALFSLLYLLAAYKCSAQTQRIQRFSRADGITTILSDNVMKFNPGGDDTTVVYVFADSVDVGDYDISLVLLSPKMWKSKDVSLIIGFEDNSVVSIKPTTCYLRSNAAEYLLTKDIVEILRSKKMDVIGFDNKGVVHYCISLKTKDYFIKFLNCIKK